MGRLITKEIKIPKITDNTPTIEAITIVILKPFAICNAVTDGMIKRADMSIIPTILMASTTVNEVNSTRMVFIVFVLTPDAFADSSSKVMDFNFFNTTNYCFGSETTI